MTLREKARLKNPEMAGDKYAGGVYGCPMHWGFEKKAEGEEACRTATDVWKSLLGGDKVEARERACTTCWDREAKDDEQSRR